MKVTKLACYFGAVLLVIGVIGFIPALSPVQGEHRHVLGIFEVNTLHNLIHLVSGITALAVSGSAKASILFFKIFAVVYGAVFVIGLLQGDTVLGLMPVNLADNLLHLAITLFAAWAGFGAGKGKAVASA